MTHSKQCRNFKRNRVTKGFFTQYFFTLILVTQGFLFGASLSHAETGLDGILLRGFGSAGAISTTEPIGLGDYGGRGTQLNLTTPLRLGLNASSKINEKLGVRGQFSASSSNSGQFTPQFDWGFVGWDAFSWLQIRGGRIIAPIWVNSQQIDVGYSYIWYRPPVEVYSLNTIRSLNGASALFQGNLGPGFLTMDLYGGEGTHSFSQNAANGSQTTVKTRDGWGVATSYSMLDESLVLGATYSQAHVEAFVDIPTEIAGAALGQEAGVSLVVPVRKRVDTTFGSFYSFSLNYEQEGFLFFSEYARRQLNGLNYPDSQGVYATLGYRIEEFTPHVTMAQNFGITGNANYHPKFPSAAVFDPAIQLNKIQSIGLGLNFMPVDSVVIKGAASKVQMAYTDTTQNFNFWVFSLVSDFVF